MERFREYIRNKLDWRRVVILLVFTQVVYGFMLLVTIPQLMSRTGGLPIPDMIPLGYDLTYLEELLNRLGSEGRQAYLNRQIPVDMVYPALFALTYSLLLGRILKSMDLLESRLIYLCLLPVIAALADYAENMFIASQLHSYPELSGGIIGLSSVCSVIKSASTSLYFLALLVLLMYWAASTRKLRWSDH